MIVTAGTLEESRGALKLVKAHPNLYSTVGVHPTRCSEFFGGAAAGGDSEAHVAALAAVLEEGKELGKVRNGPFCRYTYIHEACYVFEHPPPTPEKSVPKCRSELWTFGQD